MLDYRIRTFLTLYDLMNYRKTAEQLNMTQPSVTQHIQALEAEYGCKLFLYDGRRLSRTQQADILSQYARAALNGEKQLRAELGIAKAQPLLVGATKSIGEFVIGDLVCAYLSDPRNSLSVVVDNTACLLNMLEHDELDFAIIEGLFDKSRYGCSLMREEPFVGVCPNGHPFAGREVGFEEMLDETLILREQGSGTREILERVLADHGYSTERFRRVVCLNNFGLICRLVASGIGISFMYRAVAEHSADLSIFSMRDYPVTREFNFVYLKGTNTEPKIRAFWDAPATRQP